MSVEWMRFGDALEMRRIATDVELAKTYRPVGVRAFGRGIFDYPRTKGSDLSKVRYFDLPSSSLVVSNIKGWEGAVAVTGSAEQGRIASSRFLTYQPTAEVDPSYVRHWLLSDRGMEVLDQCSPGSADRNRTLSRKGLEASKIPLPAIDEQRRIATHLDTVQYSVADLASRATAFPLASLPNVIGDAITDADMPNTTVGELVSVVNTTIHPGDPLQGATEFVGLEHIASHVGIRTGSRAIVEETGRKFLFRPGQVTFGYLRPYLNKAWVADRTGLCSVEQFVLEPVDGLDPHLLAHLLRSAHVLDQANAATNRLQLPRLSLKTLLSMTVPDVRAAGSGLIGRLDVLRDQFVALHRVDKRRTALRDGVLPAARNEIFTAMR